MKNLCGGELGARLALSKWTTFVGESLILKGAREALSHWKTFVGRARSWENSKNPLQMDNLCGRELSTHGSSGSSLSMENLHRESLESSLQMDNLRGGKLATHGSSGSSLQMDGYVPAIRYFREQPTWVLPECGLGHPLGILQ
ncbi:hypothetical protein Acr_16g0005080 [Actinidia rufa]|uniref:Uncharacterized protein n=1 Tax=Actinidia rufa TaxID=165716 RepID=A0A7J0FZ91_9ERIC|nr:hypothetical protein Acr_16g0005080 [Actinidia rufa]